MASLLQNLADAMEDAPPKRAVRCGGWSADKQADFLRAMATGGDVMAACKVTGLSVASAYALRTRRQGALFALGWDAAVLVARARLADELLARALNGQTETIVRDEESVRRHRHDNRLAMAMLTRLDRRAEGESADAALARIVAQDFDAFVDLIGQGAAASDVALFLTALRHENPLFSVTHGYPQLNDAADETDAFSPDTEDDVTEMEPRRHEVWFEEADRDWATNFPPPTGFDGFEEGTYGDPDYRRSLTEAEESAHQARREAELAPLRAEGAVARDAYFGFVPKKPRRRRARVVQRAIAGDNKGEVAPTPQNLCEVDPVNICNQDISSGEFPPFASARPSRRLEPVSHLLGGPIPQWLIDYNRPW